LFLSEINIIKEGDLEDLVPRLGKVEQEAAAQENAGTYNPGERRSKRDKKTTEI